MQKKSQDFSMQEALRLAKSDAGQQLLAMISRMDAAQRQQAISQAATGDYEQVKKTLADILASPEAKALLKQLEGK